MSIYDNFDTYSERKLNNYLSLVDYTTLDGKSIVNLVNALYENGNKEKSKEIAEHYVDLGLLPFDRADYIPANIVYDYGITPANDLKFIETISKFEESKFKSFVSERINRFISSMVVNSGSWQNTPLSTGVLLYTSSDINDPYNIEKSSLVSSFRAGTYISDINPAAWFKNKYIDYSEDMADFILYNQEVSVNFFEKDGYIRPYYVRALSENSVYGNYDDFSFDGFLNDLTLFLFDNTNWDEEDWVSDSNEDLLDNSMYHQYECVLNISKYYYLKFKTDGEKDLVSSQILNKFFKTMFQYSEYPSSIFVKDLTMDISTTTMDNSRITMDLEEVAVPSFDGVDIGSLARIGLALINMFYVEKNEEFFDKSIELYNYLISLQQSDGSIDQDVINISDQALCLEFISKMNNMHYKSYYDFCNSALKVFNLDYIGDNNYSTHPKKFLLEECKKIVYDLMNEKCYDFQYQETILPYSAGVGVYDLSNLGCDKHRIESVEFIANNSLTRLELISYQRYLEDHLAYSEVNTPQFYALFQDNIYISPAPDKDYNLTICNFKTINNITDFNEIEKLIPIKLYPVIKYYLCWKLSLQMENPLSDIYESQYLVFKSLFYKTENNDLSDKKRMPVNINLDATKVYSTRGYSSWQAR